MEFPAASPPPSDGGSRSGFNPFNWRNWLLIAAGFFALISGTLFVTKSGTLPDNAAESVGFVIGAYIGSLLCVGLVPMGLLIGSRMTRNGRVSRGLHTAAAIVALSFAVVQLAGTTMAWSRATRLASAKAADKALADVSRLREEIAEKNKSGQLSENDIDRMTSATNKAADSLNTVDKPLAELMRQFNTHLMDAIRPVVKAQQEFVSAGGLEPSTLMNKESLSKRAAMAKANQRIAEDVTVVIRSLDTKIDELAKANGVSPQKAAGFKKGALGKGRHETLIRVRELDIDIYRLTERYFTILHDNFGKWTVVEGNLSFEDDALITAFNAVCDPLNAKLDEQEKLIKATQTKVDAPSPAPSR